MTEPRKDDDPLDVSLEDTALLAEVGLLADLIIAAQEADQHLTAEEIDRLLGLGPQGSGSPAALGEEDAGVRKMLVYVVGCLLLAACGGPSADPGTTPASPSGRPRETFAVSGFVTAEGSFGLGCKGLDSSADLHVGAPVVVRGAGGTTLATGALGDGF